MDFLFIGSVAIILYFFVAVGLFMRLTRPSPTTLSKGKLLAAGFVACVLHGIIVYQDLITPAGLNLGFFNALSLLTWIIASLLLVAATSKPVETLGIAFFPLAAIGIVLNLLLPSESRLLDNPNPGLEVHILISILAFSFLNIAAIQALLLAIQDRQLHNRHPGGFIRALPPLETMETLLFQIIGIGFILQTLSLISGAVYLENIFAQHLAHKTILSLTAWGVFAVLLFGRWRFGWRGRTAIMWTLSGFITLMLAYFGSKLVLELVLMR